MFGLFITAELLQFEWRAFHDEAVAKGHPWDVCFSMQTAALHCSAEITAGRGQDDTENRFEKMPEEPISSSKMERMFTSLS